MRKEGREGTILEAGGIRGLEGSDWKDGDAREKSRYCRRSRREGLERRRDLGLDRGEAVALGPFSPLGPSRQGPLCRTLCLAATPSVNKSKLVVGSMKRGREGEGEGRGGGDGDGGVLLWTSRSFA